MTLLHELIARAIKVPIGTYRVFTNNLHVYKDMPRFEEIYQKHIVVDDRYYQEGIAPYALLQGDETYEDFISDCEEAVTPGVHTARTKWMVEVAGPIALFFHTRWEMDAEKIKATDWRLACEEWVKRRKEQGK